MSTYIIGDVQGCLAELKALLNKINYDPKHDRLGFVGDLVSRGPQSLETLRFIKDLNNPLVVLGNHDLHCLALGYGAITRHDAHSLQAINNSSDKYELLEWLRHQPLIHIEPEQNFALVHAGIPPQWKIETAAKLANEIHTLLNSNDCVALLDNMYGDEPSEWNNNLTGWDRARYLINAFTRMRFCDKHGKLDIANKTQHSTDPDIFQPWFHWRKPPIDLIFGHWAAINGQCDQQRCYALDTGCVWGGTLTALRIEDKKRFSVPSQQKQNHTLT